MKKKLWCVLCIMICMMMIAACGQKKNPEKKKSEKAEQEETEFKDRESLKLSLFTVYYPKAWNYDKENMKKDEEYSYVSRWIRECHFYRSDQGGFIYISKEFNCLWSGFRGIC